MWTLCGLAGNMPPIVTDPSVIQSKVSSQVNIQIVAQDPNDDPITYSLLLPRPPGASVGSGEIHTHTHSHKDIPLPAPITITDDIAVDICSWDEAAAVVSRAVFWQTGHFRAESGDGSHREARKSTKHAQKTI